MKRVSPIAILIFYVSSPFAQQTDVASPIGYASVEEAFAALERDETATRTDYEGWSVFNQKKNGVYVIWSFTPENHATHPTVVRREIVKRGNEVFIKMDALCYSSKFDCDQLIAEFEKINARIKQNQSAGS